MQAALPNSRPIAERISTGFSLMLKPTGPLCNMRCSYCYYREKQQLYPETESWLMSDEVLERVTQQYLSCLSHQQEVTFHWQGGEPSLCGLDFFHRAVALQRKHRRGGQVVRNAFQTNGLRLSADWCRFFRDHQFLVGLSVDGPADLHDAYRLDAKGQATSTAVLASLERLVHHGVDVNVLCTVHRANAAHPVQIYDFVRERGVHYLQLIPIVEVDGDRPRGVSERSIRPEQWGAFLIGLFDRWAARDVGRAFVPLFDAVLASYLDLPSPTCVLAEYCGRGLVVEHNGDLYSCDHFVTPSHHLGNLRDRSLRQLVDAPAQRRFSQAKSLKLPSTCGSCPHVHRCWGGCPKNRLPASDATEPSPNYLCQGYRQFFDHAGPAYEAMAAGMRAGQSAAEGLSRWRAEQTRADAKPGQRRAAGAQRPRRRTKRSRRRNR